MNIENSTVVDENGAQHRLAHRIGRGGQGDVWLVEGGRRIVKLMRRRGNPEALRRQFLFVRRLDLRGLHVAQPLAILRPPSVGYVASFLDDMQPIKVLAQAPVKGLSEWYIETGGLRRRLRLLAHAGEALQSLHGRGVIYGDVSHNNVFVSKPVSAREAWLIDLDNLTHVSHAARAIYTPGYGAPELVEHRAGCTTLSDAWAFAVLVWQVVTLQHPFIGDMVDDEPDLEPDAFAARLPWVLHGEDDRNVCSTGLPSEFVLSRRLVDLARRCFEPGVADRKVRPGVSEWVARLHSAADQTVDCPDCTGSYFANERACPWCGAGRPPCQLVRLQRWAPDGGLVRVATRPIQLPVTDRPLVLRQRLTTCTSGAAGRAAHVYVERAPRGFSVHCAPGHQAWVAPISASAGLGAAQMRVVGEHPLIVPSKGWMVLFEPPDRAQRVALLGRGT